MLGASQPHNLLSLPVQLACLVSAGREITKTGAPQTSHVHVRIKLKLSEALNTGIRVCVRTCAHAHFANLVAPAVLFTPLHIVHKTIWSGVISKQV